MTESLQNPTVKEVSFDIRFQWNNGISYDDINDAFLRKFAKDYTKSRKTKEGKDLPSDVPFPIVLKQFLTEDEKQLVGVGNGILTVHTVQHDSFDKFKPEIQKVLGLLEELGLKNGIFRVGLRYIDEIKTTTSKALYQEIKFPTLEGFSEKGKNALFVMESDGDILNLRVIESVDNPDAFILDTDLYNENLKTIEMVLPWLEKAHTKLYTAYDSAIDPEYFDSHIRK